MPLFHSLTKKDIRIIINTDVCIKTVGGSLRHPETGADLRCIIHRNYEREVVVMMDTSDVIQLFLLFMTFLILLDARYKRN